MAGRAAAFVILHAEGNISLGIDGGGALLEHHRDESTSWEGVRTPRASVGTRTSHGWAYSGQWYGCHPSVVKCGWRMSHTKRCVVLF